MLKDDRNMIYSMKNIESCDVNNLAPFMVKGLFSNTHFDHMFHDEERQLSFQSQSSLL